MKLSPAQLSALARTEREARDGVYMPFDDEQRTFDALENRGLIEWREHIPGRRNGYVVTPAGRAALADH